MSSERVDKFYLDSIELLSKKNNTKINSEIRKLSTWLQKHQSDIIADNSKQTLLSTIESYYNFYNQTKDSSLHDVVNLLGMP